MTRNIVPYIGATALSRRTFVSRFLIGGVVLSNAGVLSSCVPANYGTSKARYELLADIARLVIPDTDTLGADAPAVLRFIRKSLDHKLNGVSWEAVVQIGEWLDTTASERFSAMDGLGQADILDALDRGAMSREGKGEGSAFASWRNLKPLIVAAYYSGEVGASQELVYEAVPGSFGTFELTPDYRARSNEGHGANW